MKGDKKKDKMKNIEIMGSFNEKNLPDMDIAVLGALEKFIEEGLGGINFPNFKQPIVAASVNALTTAEILLGSKAIYCNENNYEEIIKLKKKESDGAIVFSASGGKHAPILAKALIKAGLKTYLITCTKNSDAQKVVGENKTIITPKNREPYTYNTSTYLGWILQKTKEDPKKIYKFIKEKIDPSIPRQLGSYKGYYLLLPNFADNVGKLFNVKFEELFGTEISWQTHSYETSKHAKTVVPPQYTIAFAKGNLPVNISNKKVYFVPFPKWGKEATLMAIGYYIIGKIQKKKDPYFKKNLIKYVQENKKRGKFASAINIIVE